MKFLLNFFRKKLDPVYRMTDEVYYVYEHMAEDLLAIRATKSILDDIWTYSINIKEVGKVSLEYTNDILYGHSLYLITEDGRIELTGVNRIMFKKLFKERTKLLKDISEQKALDNLANIEEIKLLHQLPIRDFV